MNNLGVAAAALLFCAACSNQSSPPGASEPSALEGAWLMQSVHYVSDEQTQSIDPAQTGIFQFSDGRYTIMWTNTREPRSPFADLANPTDEEIKAAFRSIVFNAGRYEVEGDQVTTTAELARVPGFEGGQQFYRYKINDGVLELRMVDETYPDGSKPDWSGVWETVFVMRPAE